MHQQGGTIKETLDSIASRGYVLPFTQLHVTSALMARKRSNVHSLAVHMRVVLECAAQIVSTAQGAYEGTPKALAGYVNRFEREFQYATANVKASVATIMESDVRSAGPVSPPFMRPTRNTGGLSPTSRGSPAFGAE